MTEKEKNILNQELWVLTALDFDASKHALEISSRMLHWKTGSRCGKTGKITILPARNSAERINISVRFKA